MAKVIYFLNLLHKHRSLHYFAVLLLLIKSDLEIKICDKFLCSLIG